MSKGGLSVAGVIGGLAALVLGASAAAHLDLLTGHAWPLAIVGALSFVVWGPSVGAGVIATIALLLLALPLVVVGAALYVYAGLELVGVLALALVRSVKGLFGQPGKGPLNPLMKGPMD